MNNIQVIKDRAYDCWRCDTISIPEVDVQYALGKCPVCGETDSLNQNGTTFIFSKRKEYFNLKTDWTYFIDEPYYPSNKERKSLIQKYFIGHI